MTTENAFGPIGAYLRKPERQVDLAGYLAEFHARKIEWRLEGAARCAADPALPGKLRGAFGDRLLQAASVQARNGAPCPWSPPCGFEALFRKQGRMTPGTDFPDPWVIDITPRRNDLVVGLTLFGIACDYAAVAAEAMTAALMHHLRWPQGLEVPSILSRRHTPVTPDIPVMPVEAIRLDVTAPLVVADSGASAEHEPRRAFASLGRRLEGLARWQGMQLEHDWRALSETWHAVGFEWEQAEQVSWWRGSSRQNRRIPMRGVRGVLIVSGSVTAMTAALPVLALGAVVHAGADIVFGCGAYRILTA